MLDDGLTAAEVVIAFLAVLGFIGRVITSVKERRIALHERHRYEERRRADRERIIAHQDHLIEQRRKERMTAQQRGDATETQDR
jgi:hypothetical protein